MIDLETTIPRFRSMRFSILALFGKAFHSNLWGGGGRWDSAREGSANILVVHAAWAGRILFFLSSINVRGSSDRTKCICWLFNFVLDLPFLTLLISNYYFFKFLFIIYLLIYLFIYFLSFWIFRVFRVFLFRFPTLAFHVLQPTRRILSLGKLD